MSQIKRIARPSGLDYAAEVRCRLGSRPALLNMAAIGLQYDGRRPYEIADGIALIHIAGFLSNGARWWDETDYHDLQAEVRQASEDAAVSGILLLVNSPGGELENAFETAAVLAEAGKKKPMWAVADTMAYSAAYLMASQAAKIYVPPMTGGVGSVGVYCAHWDFSGMLDQFGLKVTLISAGEGKLDGNPYEPLSDRAKKDIAAEIQRLYGLFVTNVARGRKLSEEQIRKLGAFCYEGSAQSIAAGLADAAGDPTEAHAALVQAVQKSSMNTAASAVNPRQEVGMADTKTTPGATTQPAVENATAPAAEALAEARRNGRADAEEIAALCTIARKPALAAKFIADGKSVSEVRAELLKAQADNAGEEINGAHPPATGKSARPAQSVKERMLVRLKEMGWIAA